MNVHVKKRLAWSRFVWMWLTIVLVVFARPALAQLDNKVLRGGWYQWDPYQYEVVKNDIKNLTGLDVQLIKAIVERIGHEVRMDAVSWEQHQQDIRNGTRDIAGGAFRSQEREQYAHYSMPYRSEKDVLYVRKGEEDKFRFDDINALIRTLESGPYKLGVIDGYFYGAPLMRFIQDPRNADKIVNARDDRENFINLLEHKIDAFPTDHLVGATLGWRHGWQRQVAVMPTPVFEDTIHVMFSKKTTTPALVEHFNRTLQEMQQSGEYNRIVREYLLPVLLSQTAGKTWFFVIDIIGTIAFAISGLLLAREGRYSLFGALVLAALPSVGGGMIRDIMVNRETLSVLKSPIYLITIFATVMFFYVVFHGEAWLRRKQKSLPSQQHMFIGRISNHAAIEFFDALGLSAFAVVGVIVAVEVGVEPLWMWGPLLAALTGAGGGILRDVIRADADNPGLKGSFYAEVALIWGLVFSVFLNWYSYLPKYEPIHLSLAVAFVILGGVVTRLAVVRFKVRSPMY